MQYTIMMEHCEAMRYRELKLTEHREIKRLRLNLNPLHKVIHGVTLVSSIVIKGQSTQC